MTDMRMRRWGFSIKESRRSKKNIHPHRQWYQDWQLIKQVPRWGKPSQGVAPSIFLYLGIADAYFLEGLSDVRQTQSCVMISVKCRFPVRCRLEWFSILWFCSNVCITKVTVARGLLHKTSPGCIARCNMNYLSGVREIHWNPCSTCVDIVPR